MVKLDAKNFVRRAVPTPSTVHFDFSSADVPDSTSGIDLEGQSAFVVALFPFLLNERPPGVLDDLFLR
jgi:hypothetical protein